MFDPKGLESRLVSSFSNICFHLKMLIHLLSETFKEAVGDEVPNIFN